MSIHLRSLVQTSLIFFVLGSGIFSTAQASATEQKQQDSQDKCATSAQDSCKPDWIATPRAIPGPSTQNNASADELIQTTPNNYRLLGNVVIERPGSILISDQAKFNRLKQTAHAFGQVELHRSDLILTGTSAILNQNAKTAIFDNSQYQFTASRAHGTAKKVSLDQQDRLANLDDANYTTCKGVVFQDRDQKSSPTKKYDWELDFSHLKIDDAKRRIYGKNAVLYFKSVPMFYTPYINFPMDNRASGFLFPTFGTHQSITQTTPESYLSVPYYFNLAPNYDDTLTITQMEKRGTVLGNEFRYLEPNHSATLTTHWLRDQITNNSGTLQQTTPIADRWDAQLTANQHWAPGLNSDILWREVSDENFYADIPVDTTLDTVTTTERHINLNYQNQNFSSHISMLNYLRLRQNAPYNYEKKPEIGMSYLHNFEQGGLKNFSTNIIAEATDFQVASALAQKPEAKRTYLSPSIDYTLTKPYGHIKAEVVANKVHYTMKNNGFNNTGANEHDITIPQYALNGGLKFERNLNLDSHSLIQTLEPKIQYLFVPYQDQSNIPVFDTGVHSLDFSNLFSYNRFSGYDRIGDTQQVSAALTTRFLTSDGTPIAQAGLGQIFYLDDRKVQLSGNAIDTNRTSDYYLNLGFTASKFTFASTSQYSRQNFELTNANSRLKLDLSPKFKLLVTNTVTNNNRPGEQENLAAGFNWRMNDKWTLGSYWNHDFTAGLNTEINSALRYDSCCWASELSLKEAQLGNGLYNYSIQYLIELKGLSSVGTSFSKYLTNKLDF
ncbi:LPS-assembly protein LptD [Hydrogenovibrio kuenenii]|uniref:LPS-assembly protein LptD n=1 Tax=Hydrogenovibrio kuenenii TaxID=63658 RepID=UPI00046421B0|nr:LPS assembly protein LptD [Hydrogenovibrio kuenenii]